MKRGRRRLRGLRNNKLNDRAFDVILVISFIKSRIMADGAQGTARQYSGPIDCIVKSVASEGPLVLFRGWTASYLRLGPHMVLVFAFLEKLRPMMS